MSKRPSQTKEAYRKYYYDNQEKILKNIRERRAKNPEKFRVYANTKILNNLKQYLWSLAKHRAKRRGYEFTITPNDFEIPELCPILNVPFERKTQYAMSLDRKDSTKGYIPGNVWVISKKANSMKTDATPEELRSFARWIIFNG
jgi:hypothetical protein